MNDSLFQLGMDHGCLTGDCPHEHKDECWQVLVKYIGELFTAAIRLEKECNELRVENNQLHLRLSRVENEYDKLIEGKAIQSQQKAEPEVGGKYANCDVADKALKDLKTLRAPNDWGLGDE